MKKFVILFIGRCGGTLVSSSLNLHPDILCLGEFLASIETWKGQKRFLEYLHSEDCVNHLKDVITKEQFDKYIAGARIVKASGLNTKFESVADKRRFEKYLFDNDVTIVYLRRENMIKQALSVVNAQYIRERYNMFNISDENLRQVGVTVDLDEFCACLMWISERDRRLSHFMRKFPSAFEITYEQIENNQIGFMNSSLQNREK